MARITIEGNHCHAQITTLFGMTTVMIEHDDLLHAPHCVVAYVDGEWRMSITRTPTCDVEDWPAVEAAVHDVINLWTWELHHKLQDYKPME